MAALGRTWAVSAALAAVAAAALLAAGPMHGLPSTSTRPWHWHWLWGEAALSVLLLVPPLLWACCSEGAATRTPPSTAPTGTSPTASPKLPPVRKPAAMQPEPEPDPEPEPATQRQLALEELLTVIITTSPIQSHPSSQMLEEVLGSFDHVAGLRGCRTLLMCDGYKIMGQQKQPKAGSETKQPDSESLRAANNQGKKGLVSAEVGRRYDEYIRNISDRATKRLAPFDGPGITEVVRASKMMNLKREIVYQKRRTLYLK